MIRIAICALAAFSLAGCAGGGPKPLPRAQYERAIAGAPGAAQPSKIVAAELAFARMAREDGQWTAFRAFAAPGAIMHGENGAVDASSWLTGKIDPAESVRWNPRAVWTSCDGTVAVSNGRFRQPDGIVGSFVTVWQRQSDGEYRWIYDAGTPDDPQPVRTAPMAPTSEDDIVVNAYDSIKGLVADCNRRGEITPAPPAYALPAGTQGKAMLSRDGSLRWRWEHTQGKTRRFVAEFVTSGQWEIALDLPLGVAVAAVPE